jgi:hypothetical protein
MQFDGKVAIVYGGGGVIGGTVARAWAREGAHVFLAGRSAGKLQHAAQEIARAGGRAQVAVVDVLDLSAVQRHAEQVGLTAGRVDMGFQAIGNPACPGEAPGRTVARGIHSAGERLYQQLLHHGQGPRATDDPPSLRRAARHHHACIPHGRPRLPGPQCCLRRRGGARASPRRRAWWVRYSRGLHPFARGATGCRLAFAQRGGIRPGGSRSRNVGRGDTRRRDRGHAAQAIADPGRRRQCRSVPGFWSCGGDHRSHPQRECGNDSGLRLAV